MHDSFVMVPLEKINWHFTLFYIISSSSSSCTSPHLYSSIPSSLFPILSSLFNVFITPLLHSPLNPFTPSTISFLIFLHPSLLSLHSFYLSLYHTLYSLFLLLIPRTLFHHLFSYLSPLLSPPLSPTFTSYTYKTPLYLPPFITSFL